MADQVNLTPQAFRELPESAQIVDVRQPWEHEAARLPRSLLIPLDQLPQRLGELDRERTVALYCHHGTRSFMALRFLLQAGFRDVVHLQGGINAYSRMDPTVPRY
ncbi:MAG: rhodanese-like domain-containing protein [Acidobacteria bacterium]|nr:rhodanese-like domain-containing protein [Acidobacteriota bacterium]